LHNEEFRNVYPSPCIIRPINKDEIAGACSTKGRDKEVYTAF
jgi:hypothetical protein